jgi:hypothetical protein
VPEYPAAENINGLLAVAATDENDDLTTFSTRGSWVQVAAPGARILSSVPGGGYGTWSGTSMASPLAAGEVALLRSKYPDLRPRKIIDHIVDTGERLKDSPVRSRIDAGAALTTPPVPFTLNLSTGSPVGTKPVVGTITLNEPAPAGGTVVKLLSSNTAAATVPASITFAAGSTAKSFNISTKAVATPTLVQIIASDEDGSEDAELTVQPPSLTALTLTLATINSPCQTTTARVTLNAPAPAAGAVVTLTSSNAAAKVPASVKVAAGATYATFTVTPTLVSTKQTSTITATYRGVSAEKTLTILPIRVYGLVLSPNPVTGPNTVTGTVTLTCAAPTGGIYVALSSNYNAVAKPTAATIKIAAGAKTGTFRVTTVDVSTAKNVSITAAAGGASKAVVLQVN